jgi:hypothetical protein
VFQNSHEQPLPFQLLFGHPSRQLPASRGGQGTASIVESDNPSLLASLVDAHPVVIFALHPVCTVQYSTSCTYPLQSKCVKGQRLLTKTPSKQPLAQGSVPLFGNTNCRGRKERIAAMVLLNIMAVESESAVRSPLRSPNTSRSLPVRIYRHQG